MQEETEDMEGQRATAHLMLQPAAVGWRWSESPGQAFKLSISWPQQSPQGKIFLHEGQRRPKMLLFQFWILTGPVG